MQRRQLVLGSIASLWAARGAWADAAEPILSFAFDQDAFPTQYSLRAGTSAGVYPAIVAELCRTAGLPVSNLAAPFKRVVAGYITGGFAGGALVQTPERLAASLYTRPYYVERLRPYFARKGAAPVRSVADLAGMRVGVIRGWAYGQAFDEARRKGLFQAEEVATGFQNFMKLQRGRLDCAVETELAAALFIPRLDGLPWSPATSRCCRRPSTSASRNRHPTPRCWWRNSTGRSQTSRSRAPCKASSTANCAPPPTPCRCGCASTG